MAEISNPKRPDKRTGIITGVRDRSEVEQMIQRYLELAASALREDAPENDPDPENKLA